MDPVDRRGAEVEVALLLKRAQHRKSVALDVALSRHGTNMAQWAALRSIQMNPGLSSHALALLAFQSDQSFGALLVRLADLGWIERIPGPRRSLTHILTGEGESVLNASMGTVQLALEEEMAPLSNADLSALTGILEKLHGELPAER